MHFLQLKKNLWISNIGKFSMHTYEFDCNCRNQQFWSAIHNFGIPHFTTVGKSASQMSGRKFSCTKKTKWHFWSKCVRPVIHLKFSIFTSFSVYYWTYYFCRLPIENVLQRYAGLQRTKINQQFEFHSNTGRANSRHCGIKVRGIQWQHWNWMQKFAFSIIPSVLLLLLLNCRSLLIIYDFVVFLWKDAVSKFHSKITNQMGEMSVISQMLMWFKNIH